MNRLLQILSAIFDAVRALGFSGVFPPSSVADMIRSKPFGMLTSITNAFNAPKTGYASYSAPRGSGYSEITVRPVTGTYQGAITAALSNVTFTASQSSGVFCSSVVVNPTPFDGGVTEGVFEDPATQLVISPGAGMLLGGVTVMTSDRLRVPSGTKTLTAIGDYDVRDYASVVVSDPNLVAGNIKSGTRILGVLGSLKQTRFASGYVLNVQGCYSVYYVTSYGISGSFLLGASPDPGSTRGYSATDSNYVRDVHSCILYQLVPDLSSPVQNGYFTRYTVANVFFGLLGGTTNAGNASVGLTGVALQSLGEWIKLAEGI